MITGKTRVCGIIANPVEHSMSPIMHNFFAKETGVNLAYLPFKVENGQLEAAIKGAYGLNLLGMNVTVPYKQEVMHCLVEIEENAKVIGAVNTLVRTEGGYIGHNTDASGLLRAIQEEQVEIQNKVCIMIGAGGAARAVAYMLAKEGAKKVYILNRSLEKAESLANYINDWIGKELMIPLNLSDWGKISENQCVVIQTTSVGMHPNVDQSPIEEEKFFDKIQTAVDIVYTPLETKFMKLAKAHGALTISGIGMLLYQGVVAYELWNPNVVITKAMIEEIQQQLLTLLEEKHS